MNNHNNDKGRSFVFYESYMTSIEELEDNNLKLEVLRLIIHYGIERIVLSDVSDIAKSIFRAHQFNINESLKRRKIAIENGKKGGAPIGNTNASKNETTENNQNQPNNNHSELQYNQYGEIINLNDNVNVDENVNTNANENANGNEKVNAYVTKNEDVYENGIIKGRNIKTLIKKDIDNIAKEYAINKDTLFDTYSKLLNNDCIYNNIRIKTDSDFIDCCIKDIKERESNYD